MRRVFESDYFTVSVDEATGEAHMARTAKPFASLEEVARANSALAKATNALRGVKRVLVDLRNGPPGRNDPEFERATDPIRRELGRFERVAMLVRTAAGKLQVKRLSNPSERLQVFQDEDEAWRFLRA